MNTTAIQKTGSQPTTKTSPPRFQLIDSDEFANRDCNHEWLIEGVLVKDQPSVIGGPPKTQKTNVVVDMAVSIGTGKPFLGHFPIPKRLPVAVFSGESGEASLKDTAQRVCLSKKLRFGSKCHVFWEFDLPRLTDRKDHLALRKALRASKVKVAFFDPLYLCLNGETKSVSPTNVYEVGPVLRQLAKTCLDVGVTPVLVHHMVKSTAKASSGVPELGDLAFAGIGEFVRQWVLLRRRTAFDPSTGRSELTMTVGGSAGHSGTWNLVIHEGKMRADFTGRKWNVSVSDFAPAVDDDYER